MPSSCWKTSSVGSTTATTPGRPRAPGQIRCSLNFIKYNTIFKREAEDFPIFDQCVSALVEDLHTRGLADDCAVVIWGEFGRTPKISARVGRDHWPQVNSALLAGGGFKHGQVIGATDRIGGEAIARPVTFGEVYARLYQHLGINGATTITDLNGRPQYLVEDQSSPLPELI